MFYENVYLSEKFIQKCPENRHFHENSKFQVQGPITQSNIDNYYKTQT
jgi:hypothetical protein